MHTFWCAVVCSLRYVSTVLTALHSNIFYFENDSLKFEQNFSFGTDIIIKDISESIEPLIQSQSIYELDSLYTLEQGLIDVLTSSVLEQVQSMSNLLITEPEADIITQVSSINDVQSIKKNLNEYFNSFNVNDLFLELTELNSSFKILDKQELYLYFGELNQQK